MEGRPDVGELNIFASFRNNGNAAGPAVKPTPQAAGGLPV